MARKSRKAAPPPVAQQPETFWNAALYIRLSVDQSSGRGDSLETQRQIIEAYVALCPDIEIAEVYTDNGITGQTFEREGFQRMLCDAEAGKINCVIVKDLSRLGRNAIDAGFYVEKYFPLRHIRFIAVNDQYDSIEGENSGSHIIVPLKNMMNEAYAADIGKKIWSQKHQAMLEGAFIGARPPYGYKKDPNNHHRLLVDENAAPVVRQIFQWAIDGISLYETVKRLNESGILSPGRYFASIGVTTSRKLAGGGNWQNWTVERILANQAYTGDMVQGKSVKAGHKRVLTNPEDWIVVRNTHEPVISREMFKKVQAIRKRMAAKYAGDERNPYSKNILRGRVFCGCCGNKLHRQRCKGQYFYRCLSNAWLGNGSCTGGVRRLPEPDLFDTVLTVIRREAETVAGNSLRLKQYDEKIARKKTEVEHEITKLRRETEKARACRAGLYQNFIAGLLTQEEYAGRKESYNQKICQAVERVHHLWEQQRFLEDQSCEYFTLAERLASAGRDPILTASLVEQLIERVTVNGPEDVSVLFRFADTFAELMGALGDA